MLVNDIAATITTPFTVWNRSSNSKLFSTCCGDIPPDVALLPVLEIYAANDMIYIDVRTEPERV